MNITVNPHEQSKDNSKKPQIQIVYSYLKEHIATASMVEDATGIKQKNITRFKRMLQKSNKLWEVTKKKCQKTGFKATYITCNSDFAPSIKQFNLFE